MQHPCETQNLVFPFYAATAPYHGRATATRTHERRRQQERAALAMGQLRFDGDPAWDHGQQTLADVWRVRRIRRKPRPRHGRKPAR